MRSSEALLRSGARPAIRRADGLSVAEINVELQQGGRLVLFEYCFSVVVLTFKRSSAVFLLRPQESGFRHGLPYTLFSLLFGWWGIPWGPIYTVGALKTNLGGGKDVTRDLLGIFSAEPDTVDVSAKPAAVFERRLLRWLAEELSVEPVKALGTNAVYWKFEFKGREIEFVVIGRGMNTANSPGQDVEWLLRVEEEEPFEFIPVLEKCFITANRVRRRTGDGRIRMQFKSTEILPGSFD